MSIPVDTTADMIALRRALHAVPEVGLSLPVTAGLVHDALAPLGLETYSSPRSSSFCAVLRGPDPEPGRPRTAVLLRADMDGLPVVERTGLPFASANAAMHACGHDLHTAALVGAARELHARRTELAGDVVLIFEAGEEGVNGAAQLIEDGLLEMPDVEYAAAFGLHVRSTALGNGVFAGRRGPITGSGTSIRATFSGLGGHGALPHQTHDPVPALVTALATIPTALSRAIDAFSPVVFTPGYVHSGMRRNVIADDAEFDATLRTVDTATRDEAIAIIQRVVDGSAAAHGVRAAVDVSLGYPSVVTADAEHDFAQTMISTLLGPDSFETMAHADMMTEDFSRIADRMPSAFFFLGACPFDVDPSSAPANHSAAAVFDDSVLSRAIEVETEWAIRRLQEVSST